MNGSRILYTLILSAVALLSTSAAEDVLRFRLYLTDKHGARPTASDVPLSQAALDRRQRQGIALDSTDCPVHPEYIRVLNDKGLRVVTQSRWLNTVVVSVCDSSALDSLAGLDFVRECRLVWINPVAVKASGRKVKSVRNKFQVDSVNYYGKAETQVEMLGLDALHQAGYKGQGITIAVIDAGFIGSDTIHYYDDLQVKATRDFIQPPTTVYDGHSHGTSVLSQMASNEAYLIVGTAPEASYCLLRSEDNRSEFPIEEDYWAAAAEFADSIGADIINSSLGYSDFDLPALSYKVSQLDGKTAFVTRAASMASSKGILVVNSAGNDGSKTWRKICFPADAPEVLTVGAVNADLSRSYFSSMGPTADGRIKPDIMTLGANNTIINGTGQVTIGSGTSYASPLAAGMAACLWSALPMLKAGDLKQKILECADRYAAPDTLYGCGIPNAQKVWLCIREALDSHQFEHFYCRTSPEGDRLMVSSFLSIQAPVRINVYDAMGRRVVSSPMTGTSLDLDIGRLPGSIYLVEYCVYGVRKATCKILLRR